MLLVSSFPTREGGPALKHRGGCNHFRAKKTLGQATDAVPVQPKLNVLISAGIIS